MPTQSSPLQMPPQVPVSMEHMLHSPARGDVDIILFLSEEKLNLMGEEGQL